MFQHAIKCVSRSKDFEEQKATEKCKAIEKQKVMEKHDAIEKEIATEGGNAALKEAAVEMKKSDDPSDAKVIIDSLTDFDNDSPICLQAEYWRDQQCGCIDHCASHPLHARHMAPFFTPIHGTEGRGGTTKGEGCY